MPAGSLPAAGFSRMTGKERGNNNIMKDFAKLNRRYESLRRFLPAKIAYRLTVWTI